MITPGFLFSGAVGEAQDLHPDVKFVLIDAIPDGGTGENTVSILFAEEESGFLAGYAAIMDGARNLGFMGGIAVPAVVRFGVGFVAGAYFAAEELGVEISIPENRFVYLGTFGPSDEVRTRALSWYQDGVDIIFAAAGGAGTSVMSAAEAAERTMIGVDVDQSYLSSSVLTSAMKDLGSAVAFALNGFFADNFPGGEIVQMSSTNNGVALPIESSQFENFTEAQYNTIFAQLVNIEIPVNEEELTLFLETLNPGPTVEDVLLLEAGEVITLSAIVTGIYSHNTFFISDKTGSIAVFSFDYTPQVTIGDRIEISGSRGAFNGLQQLTDVTVEILESGLDLPLDAVDLATADFDKLEEVQGRNLLIEGFTISEIETDRHGNITFTLTLDERAINFRYDSRAAGGEAFEAMMEDIEDGDVVTITGAVLGWFNGPQVNFSPDIDITK